MFEELHELLKDKKISKNKLLAILKEKAQDISVFDLMEAHKYILQDVEFVQDGTRNEKIAADRIKYSNQIKELLDKYGVLYHCVKGNYLERFNRAKEIIKEEIGLDTKW